MMNFFEKETKTALQAKEDAQWIAFAPFVFQTAKVLRDTGILTIVEGSRNEGYTLEEVVEKSKLPLYGVRVLLEGGLGIGLLLLKDGKFTISKTGFFVLNDGLTKANMDFSHDVCYKGLFDLDKSIETGKPEGLKVFGSWKTIYEALSKLPEPVQKSWFKFDHYYSDDAFPAVLPLVFKDKPKRLLDIGGNTGKFAIQCVQFDPDVHVTIMDLPGQLEMAKANIEKLGLSERISFHENNVLDETKKFPKGFDAIWMSQFLDCFSDAEIISILKRADEAIDSNGRVYILEPFWDRQRFRASAFSLQMTSIYFTAMANGNSQMYYSETFLKLIEKAGLKVEEETNQVGVCHTLVKCAKK
jgi:ubiquinone/menaquinone biosynthesis C-methylase UbiE